jgi:hypothetical protein
MVSALADGQTVTGELVATRSLWQALDDGGNPIPNWESDSESNRPLVYPLIQSGGSVLSPTSTTWKYNNEVITWNDSTGLSTNAGFPGVFKKITYQIPGTSPAVSVTAVRIMKNLASQSTNEDSDTISVSGTVTINDTELPFESMQTVRITKAGASATVGELILTNGKSNLNGDADTVEIQARLHSSTIDTSLSNYKVEWWWNGSKQRETTGTGTALSQNHKIQVAGSEVEDYIVVEARFFVNNNRVATAFVGIDDIGDINQMQFAYTIYETSGTAPTSIVQNNTTAAVLKAGQAVLYGAWIGTKTDPLDQNNQASSWTYAAKIYAADGAEITNTSDTTKKINQPARQSSFVVGTTTLAYVATMTLDYTKIVANGGNVSVIIIATQS